MMTSDLLAEAARASILEGYDRDSEAGRNAEAALVAAAQLQRGSVEANQGQSGKQRRADAEAGELATLRKAARALALAGEVEIADEGEHTVRHGQKEGLAFNAADLNAWMDLHTLKNQGREHHVALDWDSQRVVKTVPVTGLKTVGPNGQMAAATPYAYLTDHLLSNRLFKDDVSLVRGRHGPAHRRHAVPRTALRHDGLHRSGERAACRDARKRHCTAQVGG